MNTKLFLVISLGLSTFVPISQAMEKETPKQKMQREAREAAQRRIEEQKRERAEKEALKKGANTEQPTTPVAIPKDKEEANDERDIKDIMRERLEKQRQEEADKERALKESLRERLLEKQRQEEKVNQVTMPAAEPAVENPAIPVVPQMESAPEMIPVEIPQPAELPRVEVLDDEKPAPQPEPEFSPEEQAAEQRAQASMRAKDLAILHRTVEGIITAQETDRLAQFMQLILGGPSSKNAIATSLDHANYIIGKYSNDPEFAPFISYLNGMMLIDENIAQLVDAPLDVTQWDQLFELYTNLLGTTHDDLIINCLHAQLATYTACRERIIVELQSSAQFNPDQLLHNVIQEAEATLAQVQANQLREDDATNQLIAEMLAAEDREGATLNDAQLAARTEREANEAIRRAQEDAGLAAARRLQEELNRARRPNRVAPVADIPAPGFPNDPDDSDDEGNNTPRIPLPGVPAGNPRPNTAASQFDLNAVVKNPQFLKGLMAVTGISVVGFLAYKFYNWFTTKLEKAKAKKRSQARNQSRMKSPYSYHKTSRS